MIRIGLIISLVLLASYLQGQHVVDRSHPIRKDQFVVKWKPGTNIDQQLTLLTKQTSVEAGRVFRETISQARTATPSVLDGIYLLTVSSDSDIWAICDSLTAAGTVVYAEPVFQEQMLLTPNDPSAQTGAAQYYLSTIQAYEAWDIYTGSEDIVVGVIDSGSDLAHEDLVSKYASNNSETENGEDSDGNGYVDDIIGYDFANRDNDPSADNDTHGTRVAGLVGAATNNGTGIAGIGYNTRIVPLKIFSSINNVSAGSYESIQYAADNGYDVINLSWGSAGSFSKFNQDIINYAALERDVLIVAAAGNTSADVLFYPASYDNVLSVAALDPNDEKASFATYNSRIDLAAPGVDMYSTINSNSYGMDNGSSYAAPLVAGVGALIRGRFPDLTATEVAERIKATTDPIYDKTANQPFIGKLGTGRLNAFKAIADESFTQLAVTIDSSLQTNEQLYFDDTVSLFFKLANKNDPVFLLEARMGTTSSFVTLLDSLQTIGYMDSGQETVAGPFRFKVKKNTPVSTPLSIYLQLSDESRHESYHAFDYETAPSYQTLQNDSLSITVVDDGNLGYQPDGFAEGVGLNLSGNLTRRLGFYTAFNDTVLYDNLPRIYSQGIVDDDFVAQSTIKPLMNENASSYFFSSFQDTAATLLVESYTVLWDSLPGNALGISYRVSNLSEDTLTNVRSGVYIDFESTLADRSFGTIHADTAVFMSDSTGLHQGLHFVADSSYYATHDVTSLEDTLTEAAKINIITANRDTISAASVTDVALTGTAYLASIAPGASKDFKVLIGSGDSLLHALNQLAQARDRMSQFESTPLVDSVIFACVGGAYDLIPEAGFEFYFFSDPLGADTIARNDSLRIEQITSDSTIYLSKINASGVSETVKAIEIMLFDDIANFTFSSDTVFLGDQVGNRVQLTDLSVDPIDWIWDFGGGRKAVGIQHPAPVFADTGRFDISLTIQNIQGCSDTITKTLTVLQRPNPPGFSTIGYCPDEVVQLSHADTLLVYPFASSQQALFTGSIFQLGPLASDTTLYISRLSNGIESRKTEVNFLQNPTEVSLQITSNTDSLSGFWADFFLEESYISTVQWTLDSLQSTSNPATFALMSDTLRLEYEAVTDSGCVITENHVIPLGVSNLPDITSFDVCIGEDATLAPTNGNLFGFYQDSLLQLPVLKGPSLSIDSITTETTLYVVGLDSLLPSDPLAVTISPIDYQFDILTSEDSIYLNLSRSVTFDITAESARVTWYVDSVRQAITSSPTLFFTQPGVYSIVAEGIHAAGCTYIDSTRVYVFETFVEPLSIDPQDAFVRIFPTPASNYLTIQLKEANQEIRTIRAYDLTGKQHRISFDQGKIDIRKLPEGPFFLEISFRSGEQVSFEGVKTKGK